MERVLPDLSYALRRLARAPGFAALALLTLALGIGANTAIFSIVRSVLLRPLPYERSESVVMLWRSEAEGETTWLSGPEVKGYGEITDAFSQVAAYTATAANITGGEEPERVVAAAITANLFQTLGISPL